MPHNYNINRMTCSGCVTNVKSGLLKTSLVLLADVQLASPQATIKMDQHIATSVLQVAIGSKYIITEAKPLLPYAVTEESEESSSYYPIYLIYGYIVGVTFLTHYVKGFDWMQWMNSFMAGIFLMFSFFKMLNLKGFAEGYSTYDVVAKKIPVYGYLYPFIELLLGVAFLTRFQPLFTNIATLIVMVISTIGIMQSLLKKTNINCVCLGTIMKLPLSKVTLYENLLMVVMSIIMILTLMGIIN
jgi:cation transport ATPase